MYNSLNNHLKKAFGCKVYKIALSGGMTCPNRDGTLSSEGCIFCSQKGSGDFAESKAESINLQIENAKKRVANKIKTNKYIAYFQDYTNTYAPVHYLEKIYTEAISHPDIVALSIATRPDCLPDDVLSLLEKLNKIKPVWVELGLQTIHESTAELINRCYPLSTYDTAVTELKKRNITVITHMIIGLPNETADMIVATARYIGQSGADGIKLQLLHILKNTRLAEMYQNGEFSPLSLEEYTEILIKCLKQLPTDIVIHRLTGDGAKSELIAPLWSADKKTVLNYINKRLREVNL